jgi:hypothetical protein
MTLKILPLDSWMKHTPSLEKCIYYKTHLPTTPKFNRPGMYLKGKDCWFETLDGRAFIYDEYQFKYGLSLLDVEKYNARQVAALKSVCDEHVATKEQRTTYALCVEIMKIHTNRRLLMFRAKKRMQDYRKAAGK